jgi:hypothetical protein
MVGKDLDKFLVIGRKSDNSGDVFTGDSDGDT